MTTLMSKMRRFIMSADGSTTIEFVIWFPLYMTLFLTSFELTYYGFRSVFLERAVDMQVRELRLGQRPADLDELKEEICEKTLIVFGDCERELTVDIRDISTSTWNVPEGPLPCVDRADDFKEPEDVEFGPGGAGDFLLLRACFVTDPLFSTTPWILGLPRDASGGIALVAVTTYVNEP
ncbi:TadE family protein [Aliiroseovarius sp. F20344]|uniref:TadE/TadG family type IV pilus assembly protein n=1 Tax=Aliiroseovarius sp. F20344 TaxID=2926414 RepID=UPI001FF23CDA|nr:TadE family protein [Aliiroseovarius sp. F20344]MCK0143456.1 pilus assembly protein [Aliiroseovarius sp. F20344]